MQANKWVSLALVVLFVPALSRVTFGEDNNVGAWKLNLAKSKYSPGPAPKSQTLKLEAAEGDGVKYTADGIGADGKPTHQDFTAKYDGKDYPFKGNPDADTISYKRIDANNVEAVTKKNGKTTITAKVAISKDGKTRTLTMTGKNAQGQAVKNTVVYDKQ
jgi:hypothetical protein